jgi:hypothetical protein
MSHDDHGVEDHQPDRQQRDRPEVLPEVDQGRLERGRVQQRGKEPDEHHFGAERDLRHAWHERCGHSCDGEDQGCGELVAASQSADGDDEGDQDDDLGCVVHRPSVPACPSDASAVPKPGPNKHRP